MRKRHAVRAAIQQARHVGQVARAYTHQRMNARRRAGAQVRLDARQAVHAMLHVEHDEVVTGLGVDGGDIGIGREDKAAQQARPGSRQFLEGPGH